MNAASNDINVRCLSREALLSTGLDMGRRRGNS